jgi:hypothetical protein
MPANAVGSAVSAVSFMGFLLVLSSGRISHFSRQLSL